MAADRRFWVMPLCRAGAAWLAEIHSKDIGLTGANRLQGAGAVLAGLEDEVHDAGSFQRARRLVLNAAAKAAF